MTTNACRVCSSTRTYWICSTTNEHSKSSRLENCRCRDCGSVFIANAVDAEELGVAYSTLNWSRYYAEIKVENEAKMKRAAQALCKLLPTTASVIDIGAGNGQFLEQLAAAGFRDLAGHEISPSREAFAGARYFYGQDYSAIPTASFDCVTLLDVLEHVPNPSGLLGECARILRPGGILYFHTPVVTRTDRLMHATRFIPGLRKVGRIWQRGRTSIFHLQNFTSRALSEALAKSGFGRVDVRVENELSWPVSRYVRNYVVRRAGLPAATTWLLTPPLYPLLKSNTMNANKAIVTATLGA